MKKNHFSQSKLFLIGLFVLLCSFQGIAQTTVSGNVTDKTKAPLPGVTVMEKGTTNGIITDIDGNYHLKVSDANSSVLVISFIGMETQEIPVQGKSTIDVVLVDAFTQLDEVVAVGYGTVKKRDITGAVASVGGDDLKQIPVASATEAMTGRMAGVQISSTEGSPDAEMTIRVRGGGSITQDNSPLIIVDGFPVNSLNDISPADIQSIDVLKDASSTAIYGSRGANGVIIVTTKSGKEGKVQVSYNAFTGVKKIAKKLDVLDPYDYAQWQYEYALIDNSGESDSYSDIFGNYQDIDMYEGMAGNNWQDQVYGRTGTVFSHDLSVRGGTEKMKYALSYSRFDDKAIMIGSGFTRDNVSLKLNHKASDKVDLSFSFRYSNTDIDGGGANEVDEVSAADSRLKHAITYSPIPMDGLTSDATDSEIASYLINPITATWDNYRLQNKRTYNMAASFSWDITDNLTFRNDIGLDEYSREDNRFYGLTTYYVQNAPASENQNMPAVRLRNLNRKRLRNAATLNYDFNSLLNNENHNLKLLLGNEIIYTEQSELESIVHGMPTLFTYDEAFRLTTQGVPFSTDNYQSPDDKLVSFFGRVNYDFKSKYIFSATFRADGSSKFAKGNQWGYFPSAAAAWRVSSEGFMSGTKNWLDDLKLRVSLGTAGNNNIPSGVMSRFYGSKPTAWISGFSNYWTASKTMPNPDLIWETTVTRNVGLDFAMFNSKLNGTIEGYYNTTNDLLIAFPVAGTGYDEQYRNMGETQNTGIEFSVNWAAINKADYGLSFGFNIGFNKNEIKSLGDISSFTQSSGWASTEVPDDYIVQNGGSVGEMYGYRHAGMYTVNDFEGYDELNKKWILKTDAENPSRYPDPSGVIGAARPGLMKVKDLDGDGEITVADREIIGDANPLATGGFTINAYAKGFDFAAVFNYRLGGDVYNANKIEYTTSTQRYQYRNLVSDMGEGKRWTSLNKVTGELVTDLGQLEQMNANTTMWSPYMNRYVFSDWAVEDGSFLRLSTLTLGYTIPKSLTQKARIESLRFYATAYNVFCLTNYSGFDPEVSTRRKTAVTPGVDYSAYPRSRQIVFGLNLSF